MSANLVLLNILGGVALLLWGTRMVRTGLVRAFGADLRRIIGASIRNRVLALLAGMGVTAVLQSGTATALMVASFAGRGLMATAPALAVMLGADIGSTLVAQAMSLDIHWASSLLLVVGVGVFLGMKETVWRDLGRVAIGLGLMLLALRLIGEASEPLRHSPVLHDLLTALSGAAFVTMLVAALLTWLLHSSLAAVLLIMSLAGAGAVPLEGAVVLVLGANLGGTLPAITATFGAGPEAQRVTLGNAAFKIIGCLAALAAIEPLGQYVALLGDDPARQVVNLHTALNLAIALAFLGLTGPAGRLLERLLPARQDVDDPGRPRHLDELSIDTPRVALAGAARETLRLGDIVENMLAQTLTVFRTDDRRLAAEIGRMDDQIDRLYEAIKLYVTAVSRAELDEAEVRRATQIITFAVNLEHIGDVIDKNLMDLAAKKIKTKQRFSDEGLKDIAEIHARVVRNLKLALGVFMSDDVEIARELIDEKVRVRDLEHAAAEKHLARLREGRVESIDSSALHLDILRDLKRIHSHICAVAYPVLDAAGELRPSRRMEPAGEPTPAPRPG